MSIARPFLDNWLAKGRSTFSTKDLAESLRLSPIAAAHSLGRLRKQKLIASPIQGFHVILQPANRARGCAPASEFIDYLMQYLKELYYVGLLSAAEIHGAAHHRPQVRQVMVPRPRRAIKCGAVRIQFMVKSNLSKIPTQKLNVRTGYIQVSTPESTAFDLVVYDKQAAGLDNVATVLNELAESLSAKELRETSQFFPITVLQRLGFILDELKCSELADALLPEVKSRAVRLTPLMPGQSTKGASTNKKWRVIANADLEPDL